MRVVFSDRAYRAVLAETAEKVSTETGGIFLGCFEDDVCYVVETIDPGPKSTFQVAFFEYDQPYTQHLINKVARLYQHPMTLVGLWHRHPGSYDVFSPTDERTNHRYAQLSTWGAVSALINIDPVLRISTYHVERASGYKPVAYDIGDHLIPEGLLRPRSAESFLEYINGWEAGQSAPKHTSRTDLDRLMTLIQPSLHELDWTRSGDAPSMPDAERALAMRDLLADALVDDIVFLSEVKGVVLEIKQDELGISITQKDGPAQLRFACISLDGRIALSYKDRRYSYTAGLLTQLLTKKDTESPVQTKDSSVLATIATLFGAARRS